MLFGDNMYFGNTAVDAAYLGDTQVWSAIPADVKAHIARVTADGGTVPERAKMIAMVKKLIAANLWNNCVFFGLPLGGVKKDGNQFVSKVYDLKANADLLQATGTRQPKYDADGILMFDGGDLLANSNNIYSQLTGDKELSLVCWIYWSGSSWIANYPSPIRLGNTAVTNVAAMDFFNGYPAFDIWGGRMISTYPLLTRTWYHCVVAKSPGLLSPATVSIYINGVEIGVINEGAYSQPNLTVGNIMIGANGDRYWQGNIGLPAVYSIKLSKIQAKYLFDNIRPEGV